MPSPTTLLAFAGLSAALIAVPGPSVLFIVGRAVAEGRRVALLTVVGNSAGALSQALLVAVGLGAVVQRSILVLTVLKVAGAAYLVWLGVRAIVHGRALATAGDHDGDAAPQPAASVLGEGFVVGVTNPKLIVFLVALLPQYVDPVRGSAVVQMAALGLLFTLIALLLDSAWALAAGTARRWLARNPRRTARLSQGGGAVMVGLGVHLALTGRPD